MKMYEATYGVSSLYHLPLPYLENFIVSYYQWSFAIHWRNEIILCALAMKASIIDRSISAAKLKKCFHNARRFVTDMPNRTMAHAAISIPRFSVMPPCAKYLSYKAAKNEDCDDIRINIRKDALPRCNIVIFRWQKWWSRRVSQARDTIYFIIIHGIEEIEKWYEPSSII